MFDKQIYFRPLLLNVINIETLFTKVYWELNCNGLLWSNKTKSEIRTKKQEGFGLKSNKEYLKNHLITTVKA